MKIKIAYTREEKRLANLIAALLAAQIKRSTGSGVSVKLSDRHAPFYHIYLADKKKSS